MKLFQLTRLLGFLIVGLLFSSQVIMADDSGDKIQDMFAYKKFIKPLVPGNNDKPGSGGSDAEKVSIRNAVVGNAASEVYSQDGHIPQFLRGQSGQQETDQKIAGRKLGLIMPAPFAAVPEITKGQAYVNITDKMVQNHALAQLYMTLYMTDPAVAQAATSSYSLATSLVGNMYEANNAIYGQLNSMNPWHAERTLDTLSGCQQRALEGTGGQAYKVKAWIECIGDSAKDASNGLEDTDVQATETEVAKPSKHTSDHKDGQANLPDHIKNTEHLSLATDFFSMRSGGKLAGDWEKLRNNFVKWFGDYVGNFSGADDIDGKQRKETGTTYSSYFIPTQTLHPKINYFEVFSKSKSDAYDGFRNIVKQMCEEFKNGSSPHSSSIQWDHGDDQKLLNGGINNTQWDKITLRDFRPSPAFFTAMFNQLQMKDRADSGVCNTVHSEGDESKLTMDNKLIVPFQILYWMVEAVTEVRFYDMFIAYRDRIRGELDGSEYDDAGLRLIELIEKRANLSPGETLESRREEVISRLNELHEAVVKKEAPVIGGRGGMLAATFSSSSAGTTNNGGIDG